MVLFFLSNLSEDYFKNLGFAKWKSVILFWFGKVTSGEYYLYLIIKNKKL